MTKTTGLSAPSANVGDAELLQALSRGDRRALGTLYNRYARAVWRAIVRVLGSEADADDILHTVYLKLPDLARSYDGRPNASPWLVGIGVRMALRHRRGLGRFFRMLASFGEVAAPSFGGDPERAMEREELRAFAAAFAELSPKKRAVFSLVELEGLTSEEAAVALEIPPSTVRTRLHHARLELAAALDRRGGKR